MKGNVPFQINDNFIRVIFPQNYTTLIAYRFHMLVYCSTEKSEVFFLKMTQKSTKKTIEKNT